MDEQTEKTEITEDNNNYDNCFDNNVSLTLIFTLLTII
jgi:hypothetical protein